MSRNFDKLHKQIISILRCDYVDADRLDGRFDPRYYTQAIGQAWHDSRLDELLFLRLESQMLACIGDRHLHLTLLPGEDYTPWGAGFFTRRYENDLYVTAVTSDSRLQAGDRITAINGGSPAHHRAAIQKNFFGSDVTEREDWNGMLKMASSIDILHANGVGENLALQKNPLSSPEKAPGLEILPEGAILFRPAPFDGSGRAAALAAENAAALADCSALIFDLRNASGSEEEDFYPLLPLLCRRETPLHDLVETEFFVNYSRTNCLIKAAGLQDVPGGEEYMAELVRNADRGLLPESGVPADELLPPLAPKTVVVLTDTWTRDAAEAFVQAARRAGAYLLGRATLGTLDYCGDVSYALDDRFILRWPTAVTRQAREGRGVRGVGLVPDRYIPWTPEECRTDVLLAAALKFIKESDNL